MPASVFDLVNSWTPHPTFPGYYRFGTKLGVWGFAWEDGHTFQVAEMYPVQTSEQIKFASAVLFLRMTMQYYPCVIVELVRKPDLLRWLITNHWGMCSVRTVARTTPYYQIKPRRSGAWCLGVIWDGTKRHTWKK